MTVHVIVPPAFALEGRQDNPLSSGPLGTPEPVVNENATGASPLTSAITVVMAPGEPDPIVNVVEA